MSDMNNLDLDRILWNVWNMAILDYTQNPPSEELNVRPISILAQETLEEARTAILKLVRDV